MSGRDFPADEILLARGRYATLSSERRAAEKALHADMMAISDITRRIVRAIGDMGARADLEFVREELDQASRRVGASLGHFHTLATLEPLIEELKPIAWGKAKDE